MQHWLRRHWHRPHHYMGWGMVLVGAALILFVLPAFVWAAVLGAYLCYLGWQLLSQR